ncbi:MULTISPECIES: DUF2905 domain-containing protein [Paenibacillus]|mgnify:CR=1 FL=1|jgi:hypothetical protein|uniref:DUF2905 domain-containing protein n=1 Tax=Paenibacillus TaxID=44249 RepID=UPI0004921BFE|nr:MULTISPECIES: DUF2905 domain-containing protein [Paenibacillus]MCT2194123.1 DUF2905 domain-containing protein [Paenibacillus sp. p3-SID1389]MEC2344857.1 DUF2905 domain-containing protein [Paenibacillus barengoltzii]SMF17275.1 Protein of unknown function [Paenibacillus barengoltzii]
MSNVPKILIVTGAVLIVIGLLWMFLGRFVQLGRLPGDIAVERGNFRFYFPIVTCIVLSVVFSLIMAVIRWLMK